nr:MULTISPECIES: helix-turn-helix transcriptional regulator [unclassified Mesorhizobium]
MDCHIEPLCAHACAPDLIPVSFRAAKLCGLLLLHIGTRQRHALQGHTLRQAGLTQAAVAKALDRHQPFIANIENGDRRLDLVEFLDLAKVVGFDPYEVIAKPRPSTR